MKRFYTLVSSNKIADGFEIHLDGKPVKTPARQILKASTVQLADALMQEWASQTEVINPETMPLTQLISTKTDRVIPNRKDMQKILMDYLDTDLVCYFTNDPPQMATCQEDAWRPALEFFEQFFSCTLKTTTDLVALTQDDHVHRQVGSYIEKLDDDRFTLVQLITALSGSIILAIGFIESRFNDDDLLKAIFVEEDFKADLYDEKKYGADPSEEKKRENVHRDLRASVFYRDNL